MFLPHCVFSVPPRFCRTACFRYRRRVKRAAAVPEKLSDGQKHPFSAFKSDISDGKCWEAHGLAKTQKTYPMCKITSQIQAVETDWKAKEANCYTHNRTFKFIVVFSLFFRQHGLPDAHFLGVGRYREVQILNIRHCRDVTC